MNEAEQKMLHNDETGQTEKAKRIRLEKKAVTAVSMQAANQLLKCNATERASNWAVVPAANQ